jgi:TRAP-type C4-dicarboxylate transport system substrate-binding protein
VEINIIKGEQMKNLKWLIFILVAVMLVVAPLLAACTSEEEGAPPEGEEAAPPEEEEPPEVIELTYASPFPDFHPTSVADLAWIEKIDEETNGMVHITPYWGGALMGPVEAFDECVRGVADIASVSLAYSPAGFDIVLKEACFYYGVPSWEVQRQIYSEVHSVFPEDEKLEQVMLLERNAFPPYHVFTCTQPVHTLEDFAGLSFKAMPETISILAQLGAEGRVMSMFDVYVSLEKGIIDGLLGPYEALESMNFADVIHYSTRLDLPQGFTSVRVMNLDSWNSLPADIQEVFEDNIEWWGCEVTKNLYDAEIGGIEFGREAGVEFIELPQEDFDQFYAYWEIEALNAAAELDAMGYPGTELFEEVRRLIEEYS